MSTNAFVNYVIRESDLDIHLANIVQTKETDVAARLRGWNTYYKGTGGDDIGHKAFINERWEDLPKNTSDDLTNPTKFSKEWYMNKVSPYNASTGDYTDSDWTQYSIDDATSDKKANAIKAAKRMLARDYHTGQSYFAPGNEGNSKLPEGKTGQERGFNTYVIPIHTSSRSNNTKKSIIRLNAAGTGFQNNAAGEAAVADWGQFHWDNDGKYESRVLAPVAFTEKDGKVTYNDKFVGEGIKQLYDDIANKYTNAKEGDYSKIVNEIYKNRELTGLAKYEDDFTATNGQLDQLGAFYIKNKITTPKASWYAEPPMGTFNESYYLTTTNGQAAKQQWKAAQSSILGIRPDLDITHKYGNESNWIRAYYTNEKRAGVPDRENRGNKIEDTKAATDYLEGWSLSPDDPGGYDKDTFLENYLGLTKQGASGTYSVDWDNPFVTEINEDGEEVIVYDIDPVTGNQTPRINPDSLSLLEGSVFNIFGRKDLEQQDKFQALAFDLLKTSIDKLDQERKRESELNMYMGLPGFNEIYGANASIANSLIGDSGLGGYLSMAGVNVDKLTESLESGLSGVTGISNNSSVYNWQKWFDENLLKRYEEMEEITGKLGADIEELNPILDNETWTSFQASADDYQTKITNRENKVAKAQEALDELEGQLGNLLTELEENETENIEQNENVISLLEEIKKAKTNLDNKTEKLNKIVEQKDTFLTENNISKGLSIERALEISNPENWKALLEKYDLPSDTSYEDAKKQIENNEELKKIYTIDNEFRQKFIDDYIKPRFDQSKSMDEFISYLDTLDPNEQNVFQTQDAMQALKNVASAYSANYLRKIEATPDARFDSEFYMNPTSAIDERYAGVKDDDYRRQEEIVNRDWEAAKANGNSIIPGTEKSLGEDHPGFTWNQYAYYYDVDLTNKEQFARLHYDAIGSGKLKDAEGKPIVFDPAKDIISDTAINGYIIDTVIPAVENAKLELDDAAFSEFTTPEEFADELLKGIDPTENNPEWKEILEEFGLDEATSLDELKEYIIDITRTGAAQDIREAIKYLNEKKLTPTQERLGVSYIEREEDANPIDEEGTSALYQIFSNAGYAGTEDEFFTEFMPDAERGDIALITQSLAGGGGFNLEEISSDPFVALSQVGGLMGDSGGMFGDSESSSDQDEPESDYFSLFPDDKDDYKTDAGRDYIKEYTSFFSS